MNKTKTIILEGIFLITLFFSNPVLAQSEKKEISDEIKEASTNHTQEKEIIQIISQQKEKYDLKSVIFGVWQDNKLIASGALGESMEGVPATKEMHFRIGGVTETMVPTILLQLVDEGKVKLDDPISKWAPDLPNADRVTLRMLANSTTGYPDYERSTDFEKAFHKDVFKHWTTKELLNYAFAKPPLFEPGARWDYAHTNFVVLGYVLEKITQKPIAQLLQERIFDKLDLKKTTSSLLPALPEPVLHAYTSERGKYEESTYWSPSWVSFSGLVSSNIEDLGKWINAFGSGVLLSKESYQAMMTPVIIKKEHLEKALGHKTRLLKDVNPELGFGLGFGILDSWLIQNPAFGGYSGFFAYLPSKKLGIIVYNTLNAQNSTQDNYSQFIVEELAKKLTPDALIPSF